jgi:hypothetical protein
VQVTDNQLHLPDHKPKPKGVNPQLYLLLAPRHQVLIPKQQQLQVQQLRQMGKVKPLQEPNHL